MMTGKIILSVAVMSTLAFVANAFAPIDPSFAVGKKASNKATPASPVFMSDDDFLSESPEDTQERIQALVDAHPVLLFMKGSKLFPQCGFSNNAVQILSSFGLDFHTVDVLADQNIREGVKVSGYFSL